MNANNQQISNKEHNKFPIVIDGFIQPGFPFGIVYTCFFMIDCLVFVKTGSFGTNIKGSIHASQGGYTSDSLILGAIGGIIDMFNSDSRMKKAANLASLSPTEMVKVHKRNFLIPISEIKQIEIKGPNFAHELRIRIQTDKLYKFRLDKQSKYSAQYLEDILRTFIPSKIQKK
jgi:hypothetical protein